MRALERDRTEGLIGRDTDVRIDGPTIKKKNKEEAEDKGEDKEEDYSIKKKAKIKKKIIRFIILIHYHHY